MLFRLFRRKVVFIGSLDAVELSSFPRQASDRRKQELFAFGSFRGNRLHLSPIALISRKSNLVEVNITSDSPFPGVYKVRSWETTSMEDIYDDSKRFSLENLVIPISKYRPTFLVD